METELGKNFTRLVKDFEKNASAYSVFYASFLAEKLIKKVHPENDEEKLDQKGLKFRPHESYVFPTNNIRSIDYNNNQISFVINFLGLYGINSPLPRCYHEQVALQQNVHGPGEVPLQNFLDIFNNRFYWLYYNAWKKYRYYLQINQNPENKAAQRIFSFIGQGPLQKKRQPLISNFKLLQLSGLLSNRVRSKAGLLILLKEYFPRFEIDLEEFVPTLVKLANTPKVGRVSGQIPFQLGANSVIGRSVLDYMSRVRLIIRSISFEDYLRFIPGGESFITLKQLMELYLNDGLEYDVKFVVDIRRISKLKLSDPRLKMGLSMWLGKPKQEDVEFYYDYEKFSRAS